MIGELDIVALHTLFRKDLNEIEEIINYGPDLTEDYLFSQPDYRELLGKLRRYLSNDNVKLVTYWSEDYPEVLREIPDPPVYLFIKGNFEILKREMFAVVGTRRLTPYGKSVTAQITKEICHHFVIVSGMAYGIDSVAHETALSEGRPTVAVLGCGVEVVYPKSNLSLYKKILENGCVVSEYLPWETPKKYTFVQRNRIISGLSKGTLVTEAGLDSGALITARFALEQGRDVFAVPGDITREASKGTNYLIKNGAFPVTDPSDILDYYGFKSYKKIVDLTESEKEIYDALSEPRFVEDISEALGKSITEILVTLTVLELKGIVLRRDDGTYQRVV
ncbi:DNA-processing protein DprA [Fervidobacterium thailandense]|uniref:DNA processing protein DprA n=1 Tax=Fervidobacterium thailandense TaxID=1008305 RepID=A0A1E3G617_9BACT|nr:DNA-processing protein DprA [Fervidobacterium thailandense]ODN31313.1 DNA processing protein DprA [Fervidobacterium thailandense]